MKLLNKITIWFIGIVILVTPVSMYISFHNIKSRIDNAEVERMTRVNDRVAVQLRNGETPDLNTQGRLIELEKMNGPLPEKKVETQENSVYNQYQKKDECILTVNSYYEIGGQNYRISSFNYVTKSSQILSGMLNAVIWKMLLLILAVAVTAQLLSRYIFSPFRKTMKAIHNFNLKKKEKLQLPSTNTKEFRELNAFLQKMTDKAVEEYATVKEFSENASHEIQTPLAVLMSKLELLVESDIDEKQAALIEDMEKAIGKLSRINRSLLLLTKLENREYATSERIQFCHLTKEVLVSYTDRIALKNITIESNVDKNISLNIHPALAEILLNNLLSNAIRHNIEGGSIHISVTASGLRISNTGSAPEIPTEELFKRFKKSKQCDDSIGLGLAIVKQICEVNHFSVTYTYHEGWHTISVRFDGQANMETSTLTENVTGNEPVIA